MKLKLALALALLSLGSYASPAHAEFTEEGSAVESFDEGSAEGALRPWPGRGRGPRFISCVAQDAFGRAYRAGGRAHHRMVQNQAVRQCQRFSRAPRTCRPVGCRW